MHGQNPWRRRAAARVREGPRRPTVEPRRGADGLARPWVAYALWSAARLSGFALVPGSAAPGGGMEGVAGGG